MISASHKMDAEKSAKEGKMGEFRPITVPFTRAHAYTRRHTPAHPNGADHMHIYGISCTKY